MGYRRGAATTLLTLSLLVLTSCDGSTEPEADGPSATPTTADPTGAAPATDQGAESDADEDDRDDEDSEDSGDAEDSEDAGEETASPSPAPTESDAGGAEPVEDSELPGQAVITYYSQAGVSTEVIRVSHEDSLNVRGLPGVEEDPIATLPPDGAVELAGRERLMGSNPWAEVVLDDGVGWVNTYYLGFLGDQEDVTEDFSDLGPTVDPRAAVDMVAARAAAAARDGTRYAYWDLTGAPEESERDADEQRWTLDLTTPGDEAILGERLSVRLERQDGSYTVEQVERSEICARGVSDGSCL